MIKSDTETEKPRSRLNYMYPHINVATEKLTHKSIEFMRQSDTDKDIAAKKIIQI